MTKTTIPSKWPVISLLQALLLSGFVALFFGYPNRIHKSQTQLNFLK